MTDGSDAFAARIQLVEAAEVSVDLQSYIFKADTAGVLMTERLFAAARRGVRVRLLLDDNHTDGLEPLLAMMGSHPNVQVRLFNPFASRVWRLVGLLTDFRRLNARMHAKCMIVDNQVAIIGGRNIGDAYFDLDVDVNFTDLDMLAVGAVVAQASATFDDYWNSARSYPLAALMGRGLAWSPDSFTQVLEDAHGSASSLGYAEALAESHVVDDLLHQRLAFEWAVTQLWSDDVEGQLQSPQRPPHRPGRVVPRLKGALGAATSELDLVSPYFVPDDESTMALQALARRGVRVRILTNSLAATDVAAVHAGYIKHRVALLQAGVKLFELKPTAAAPALRRRFSVRGGTLASLHAKAFSVDRQRVFVGSFNLDPRSAQLNAEMVLAIESSAMAAQLSEALNRSLPAIAYEVTLSVQGRPQWQSAGETMAAEPEAGVVRRLVVQLLSLMPIDWLL